jgi:acyl carrier protein
MLTDDQRSQIAQRVQQIVMSELGVKAEDLANNRASFISDLGADDLDCKGLIAALGTEFGVEVPGLSRSHN